MKLGLPPSLEGLVLSKFALARIARFVMPRYSKACMVLPVI
ncbi:hypothetical protein [Desulfosporosinus fructosivorans]